MLGESLGDSLGESLGDNLGGRVGLLVSVVSPCDSSGTSTLLEGVESSCRRVLTAVSFLSFPATSVSSSSLSLHISTALSARYLQTQHPTSARTNAFSLEHRSRSWRLERMRLLLSLLEVTADEARCVL